MPSMIISGMQAAVGAGANYDVIPPAGQAYLITDVGNDVAFVANVPDVEVHLRDAVLADAIILRDPTTDPGRRVNQMELYITPTNYMRLTNTGAGAGNLSWYGIRVNFQNVRNDLVTLGAGATVNIQPPVGETWKLTTFGYSVFTGAGDLNPDCSIGITDGVLVASVAIDPTMVRGQDKIPEYYIDNNNYLIITDTGGAGGVFGYSGVRVPQTCITDIQDVIAAGTLDCQPPPGQEWVVTEIAAEIWAGGGAPNDYPDVNVSMIVGANLSDLLEGGSVSTPLRWNSRFNLFLDNTHYLRFTNLDGAAANETGWMGYLRRTYS